MPSALLPVALQFQRDMHTLCSTGAAATAFPTTADLAAAVGQGNADALLKKIRNLTHLSHDPFTGLVNSNHLPGYLIPFICNHTQMHIVMTHGISLEVVMASIQSLQHSKTRGYNVITMWDNAVPTVARASAEARRLSTVLHKGHAIFDPHNGFVADLMTEMRQFKRALSVAETAIVEEQLRRSVA